MSSNFISNLDIVNSKYPNQIDIYQDAVKEMLKAKKKLNTLNKTNINNHQNFKELNLSEDNKQLIELEDSYKNSLILLNMMQKKIEQNLLEKYNININNQEIQNALIKKNF